MAGSGPDDNEALTQFTVMYNGMQPWLLGKGEIVKAWSDVDKGERVLWWIGDHVKIGTVLARKGISLKVHFDGDIRPTNIPNARSYFAAHRMGKKHESLYCVKPTMRIKGRTPKEPKKKSRPASTLDGDLIRSSEAVHTYGITGKELRRLLRNGKVLGLQEEGHWKVDATSLGRYLSNRG